ncbi:hypothetical protein L9F63_013231, partial [Diploptera punctata]
YSFKKIGIHLCFPNIKRIKCTSCERSLNYATKMARMLQSSTLKFTGTYVACMGMIFNISYGAVYDIVHENLKF